MRKQIKHLKGFDIFYADEVGNVYRKDKGEFKLLTTYRQRDNLRFVRLNQEGRSISITVGKCVLLAFRAQGYRKGLIAVLQDGNHLNTVLYNLKWGSRKDQSAIAMKRPENYKIIQKIGRENGKNNIKKALEWKKKWVDISEETKENVLLNLKSGMTNKGVRTFFGISKSTLYRIKTGKLKTQSSTPNARK